MIKYQPNFESVKSHPLPKWYDDAKFGIFIHWGVYSVPAYAPTGEIKLEKMLTGEITSDETPYAEWYQNSLRVKGSSVHQHHLSTYGAEVPYESFVPQFNQAITAWDPEEWAETFACAGARYVVLVSKHHDGFLMWDSRYPNPHIPGWGVTRDIVGELTNAVSKKGMKMGLYYSSLLDWTYTQRPIRTIPDLIAGSDTSRDYVDYVEKHWLELIERYDPWILWGDIGYPPGYKIPELFAYFYNRKPDGVVNDRWVQLPRFMFSRIGRFILSKFIKKVEMGSRPTVPHCDFITPEYAAFDHIIDHKWETCRGIGNSFGYNQIEDDSDYKNADELIRLLADIVSKNGNLLLNVGPCADGSLHPAQVTALKGIGNWLKSNGEAIYGTRSWVRFRDDCGSGGEIRYTTKDGNLYIIVIRLPDDRTLSLPLENIGEVILLRTREVLEYKQNGGSLVITLPEQSKEDFIPVLKITGIL